MNHCHRVHVVSVSEARRPLQSNEEPSQTAPSRHRWWGDERKIYNGELHLRAGTIRKPKEKRAWFDSGRMGG
jgi:hypothetical protein